MGAWGLGAFENDDACDWLADIGEKGPEAIDLAFEAVFREAESEVIDSEAGSNAVAALEILARVKEGKLDGELLELSGVDARTLRKASTPNRVEKAKQVAALVVRDNSELAQVWTDADQFEAWKKMVDDIIRRLEA